MSGQVAAPTGIGLSAARPPSPKGGSRAPEAVLALGRRLVARIAALGARTGKPGLRFARGPAATMGLGA